MSYGLVKTSLSDFPGLVAAVVFTPGCNLRCPFCHNPELLSGSPPADSLNHESLMAFLTKRSKVLGGVAITGGEPLLFPHIQKLIDDIHSLGLQVKLDTNGTLPEKLKETDADFYAMDIKTSPHRYGELGWTGNHLKEKLVESINLILTSGKPYEFRTTMVPGLVGESEVEEICHLIQGANEYVMAQFRPDQTLDPTWGDITPYSKAKLESLRSLAVELGIPARLRSQ